MKRIKIALLALSVAAFVSLTACSEDSLSPQSVFNEEDTSATPLDEWLLTNYIKPYNINLQYRYLDMESDMVYTLVPAAYTKSWQLAKLVQFLCLESYDTITGSREFIRSYFPKMIFLVGSPAYNNNGSIVLGTAEGGTKITLYNVNNLVPTDVSLLNSRYFKTIHHEFTHILNQTKPFSTDFDQITGTATGIEYVGNSCWTVYGTDAAAQADGFISRYSSTSATEDFAELVSLYVTNSAASWESKLTAAGTTGRPMIENKFEIVAKYMKNEWNIDLDELRDEVQRRQALVPTIDWDSLN